MKVTLSFLKIFILLCVIATPLYSFAQDDEENNSEEAPPPPPRPKTKAPKNLKQKRVEVNFEDQLIKGEVQKPELFYLLQKKQFNFSKLIKLRENFLPEMKKTADDIPRGVED